jgi:tetratricopeptide (TPR) repeat protein
MRRGLIGGGIVAVGVVVWVVLRNPVTGLRSDPEDALTTTRAIAFFEARVARDSIDVSAASALASRYVLRFQQAADLADLRRAERALERTLPYTSDGAAARANLSAVQLMQHDFGRAYRTAIDAVAARGTRDDALGAWFDAALATGRLDEAARALAGMDKGTLARNVRSSHWLDAHGDTEGAFDALEPVCEQVERSGSRPPLAAWCLTLLAGLEQARSGDDSATRLYQKALRIVPGYRGAIEGLADIDHANSRWRRAIAAYEHIAVDAHPDLYLRLAEASRALGNESRAGEWEAEFVRAAGDPSVEALYAHPLALYWAERPGERDRALDIARRDVARRPAPDSWDVLAWVHFRRGELEQSLEASDNAFFVASASPTILYHRARILHALGRSDEASLLLRTAIAQRAQLDATARIDLDRTNLQP